MQEIDEKAPVMKKQREDYEKSLHTINQLTRQLDSAMLVSIFHSFQSDLPFHKY